MSDGNFEPQNLYLMLTSSKVYQHEHLAHSWNKANPKTNRPMLPPNPVEDNETECPIAAAH